MTFLEKLQHVRALEQKTADAPWFSDGEPSHGCCWEHSIQLHDGHERADGGIEPNTTIAEIDKDDGDFVTAARNLLTGETLDALDGVVSVVEEVAQIWKARKGDATGLHIDFIHFEKILWDALNKLNAIQ